VEITNGCGGGDEHGHPRKFVMGRNMHGSCLQITEPELNDKETGEKEAYMSAVLAQYKEILVERTKFHLGVCVCVLCSSSSMEDRSSISENLWSFFITFILMMFC
jgi:hypothetical protein